jgi:hypothetical protein
MKQDLDLEPINELLHARLQRLSTDLLSASSKLITLSEQKCASLIVSECQKLLPLNVLACTQILERSDVVKGL